MLWRRRCYSRDVGWLVIGSCASNMVQSTHLSWYYFSHYYTSLSPFWVPFHITNIPILGIMISPSFCALFWSSFIFFFSYFAVLLFSYLMFCLAEIRLSTSALSEATSPYHYCGKFWILILWLCVRHICWCCWGKVWNLVICSFWSSWNYAICRTEGQRRHVSRLLTNFKWHLPLPRELSEWFMCTHTRIPIMVYTLRNKKYHIYPVITQTLCSSYLVMRCILTHDQQKREDIWGTLLTKSGNNSSIVLHFLWVYMCILLFEVINKHNNWQIELT